MSARDLDAGGPRDSPEEVLAVFPLTGVLLLPGTRLPLHVFEPRYRNMVRDAIDGDRRIGVIQPLEPAADNGPFVDGEPGSGPDDPPPLYRVGCVGELEQWEQTQDGRYVILLRGLRRFRALDELPVHRGYRQLVVGFEPVIEEELDAASTGPLIAALRRLAREHRLAFDFDRLEQLPPLTLVNTLAMGLPFASAEKQALLEAASSDERRRTLLSLIEMGLDLEPAADPAEPSVAH